MRLNEATGTVWQGHGPLLMMLLQVSIKGLRLCRTGPPPKERSCINTVQAVPGSAGGYILCGGSDGHLKVLSASTGSGKENGRGLITCAQAQLPSTICSIAWRPSDAGMEIIVGTAASELFCVGFKVSASVHASLSAPLHAQRVGNPRMHPCRETPSHPS